MVRVLRNFELNDPDVGQLRCLLHGPVGAGKSSFINSVNNVFQGRITSGALVAAASGTSFTMTAQENGMQPEDIISALKGHLPEGYKFNPCWPLTEESAEYNKKPTSSHKVHCLVSVVPADKISLMTSDVIAKMRKVREKASKLDKACDLVDRDVKNIYTSKAIKEKMQICSNELGVPMNCILPVKNYHEEGVLDDDMDILILNAMTQIMHFANDYLWDLQQHA
ncbi:unnamed protein product, partial [Coregonus sp. 'balchen']